MRIDADTKSIVHEHLHARSCSYYSAIDYVKNRKLEEGAVELFAQQICSKNGIDYIGVYKEYVKPIRQFNSILKINKDEYLFAKEFFEIEMTKRYEWMKNKAENFIKDNPDLNPKQKYKLNNILKQLKSIKR